MCVRVFCSYPRIDSHFVKEKKTLSKSLSHLCISSVRSSLNYVSMFRYVECAKALFIEYV